MHDQNKYGHTERRINRKIYPSFFRDSYYYNTISVANCQQPAKLVHNLPKDWKAGVCRVKTLGSRRYLGRSHGYQVMVCQDPDSRGCNLSTAASDTERERVFTRRTPASQSLTA